jgi:acyl-CoA reductase-like NAD-dependent aldehyde dehydrogenase
VDDPWQALRHANDNRYGLAGFVFTRDLARGLTLCEGMEAGSVWLNDIQRSSHYEPFGGVKESGLGREKGRYGVESYLEYKTMYLSYEVPQ